VRSSAGAWHDHGSAQRPVLLGQGSESELIDGVGHFLMVERPVEINEKIVRFLRR
jgi:pimeloyl-ACP methyl ester carboxylesterase